MSRSLRHIVWILTLTLLCACTQSCAQQASSENAQQREPENAQARLSNKEARSALSRAEALMTQLPDSALMLLESIDGGALRGRENRAHYALLYSQALDKNYIDRSDFKVLQPALDYYRTKGNATNQLRTFYYQGRIYENQGRNNLAMQSFVTALEKGKNAEDDFTKALALFSQAKIYNTLYEWDNCLNSLEQASSLFKEAERHNSYVRSLAYSININTLAGNEQKAKENIALAKKNLEKCDEYTIGIFYSSYLMFLTSFDDNPNHNLLETANSYIRMVNGMYIDWLSVANVYLKLNIINEAQSALLQYTHYNSNMDDADSLRYLALMAEVYKGLNKFEESLLTYENYMALSDSLEISRIQQGTEFVEERYKLELQNIQEKEDKQKILLCSIILCVLSISFILIVYHRLKIKSLESERHQLLCQQLETERDNLTLLLSKKHHFNNDINDAITKRLNLLNKFFAATITQNNNFELSATNELRNLISDKDAFMASTKKAFAGSHPNFIKHLEEKGLTDWEIQYCCLYALGLRGKEIGIYLHMRSHYNISYSIRKKLDFENIEANLGIYIRNLLKTTEESVL